MKQKKSIKVFVGMSGGVDSSVAAFLLQKQGYDVIGVFMRCYNIDGCAEGDAEDARRVAGHLGIPFYVWDFEEEYKKKVVEYMVDGYRKGLTPNPDVECNREVKFGLFLKKALAMGADYVATGHYVRLARHNTNLRMKTNATNGRPIRGIRSKFVSFVLREAKDSNKDQSYFLWTLTQDQLKHCLFPIGDYLKPEVRKIAVKAGLPTAAKKDSQGICFLGRVRLDDFLGEYIKPKVGQVRLALPDGSYEIIGEHSGAQFYTIGQRHGIQHEAWSMKHEASKGRDRKPYYVASKNVRTNTLVVAEGSDNEALYRKEVTLRDVNFIDLRHSNILQNVRTSVFARVRYRQPLSRATLCLVKAAPFDRRLDGAGKLRVRLIFNQSQKFVAPGQSAVFYSKRGELLGGGVIV